MSENIRKISLLSTLLLLSFKLIAAPSDHFVTTWETSVGDTVITIPTFAGDTYSYAIDWDNDMVPDETGITGDVTHDYGSAGVHTIRIFGTFPRIFINNGTEKDKILSIEQWGTNTWISMANAFSGASNLVINANDTPDLSNVTSLFEMFEGASNIGNGTGNWNWDTSNITGMSQAFKDAVAFDENISSWNVENVDNFAAMFAGATLSDANYDALLISWDTQNVNPNRLFTGGFSQYCSQAAQDARANLIATDVWTITDGGLCSEPLFRTTWKTDNPGTSNNTSITIPTEPIATYAYQVDWNGDGDFNDTDETTIQTGDATHDYGMVQTNQTINIKGLFPQIYFNGAGDKDKILSIDQWGSNLWTSMAGAFRGSSNLINKASDIPNLSNVDSLLQTFYKASSIGSTLDTGNWNWDTSTIQTFGSMFDNATLFNKDISTWNIGTANIVMATMFKRASSFNQNISSWTTGNVKSMQNMFFEATSFDQDLSSWNIESVTFPFGDFLINTAFSTNNYDALLIAWDNQNVNSGLILNVGTNTYCSQAAVDARANLVAADMWMITDGGHTNACDIVFENSFENVIVVKSAQQHITYDFSKVNLDRLRYQPELIIKGTDDNNKVNMNIHIRNDLGIIQIRISHIFKGQWQFEKWQNINNLALTNLYWEK